MIRESRVQRLETAFGAPRKTIIAVVPEAWDEDDVQAGIARLRQTSALPSTWEVSLTRDQNITAERLLFAGSLEALSKHVAKHSSRIGVAMREGQA
ncbi:hypothetical protein K3759_09635 [Sulfitobacter sp. W027]|uniref:hypothetical protein n=1 Tax=Sulfitobacter sp. W027 TaxID=2867025 RepID=UPI0021A96350|nr:hypothetical protein [Sulfitobacter sp. W027]UWR32229.1 hypothetical protein K3759_09635 [Sulfitobacter sp. W027]